MVGNVFQTVAYALMAVASVVIIYRVMTYEGGDSPYPLTCQEDEVIVGTGDYDGSAWDEYVCVPADDLYESPIQ